MEGATDFPPASIKRMDLPMIFLNRNHPALGVPPGTPQISTTKHWDWWRGHVVLRECVLWSSDWLAYLRHVIRGWMILPMKTNLSTAGCCYNMLYYKKNTQTFFGGFKSWLIWLITFPARLPQMLRLRRRCRRHQPRCLVTFLRKDMWPCFAFSLHRISSFLVALAGFCRKSSGNPQTGKQDEVSTVST